MGALQITCRASCPPPRCYPIMPCTVAGATGGVCWFVVACHLLQPSIPAVPLQLSCLFTACNTFRSWAVAGDRHLSRGPGNGQLPTLLSELVMPISMRLFTCHMVVSCTFPSACCPVMHCTGAGAAGFHEGSRRRPTANMLCKLVMHASMPLLTTQAAAQSCIAQLLAPSVVAGERDLTLG